MSKPFELKSAFIGQFDQVKARRRIIVVSLIKRSTKRQKNADIAKKAISNPNSLIK